MARKDEIAVETAKITDISVLVSHYGRMFREIYDLQNIKIRGKEFNKMTENYGKKLRLELKNGVCRAWVVKNGDNALASGAVSIISMVPVKDDPSFRVAYLHSIYTEKSVRKKGYAAGIIKKAIGYCKSEGIRRMILNASDEGSPLYQKMGFELLNNTMRLWIK